MKTGDFEKLVARAIDSLPENIRQKMDNVEIVVEKGTPFGHYLGLYQGIPKIAWGRSFGMVLPDKITIFQAPLERMASNPENLEETVKNVVWHEIGHHFGYGEKEIRELEKKRRELEKKRRMKKGFSP
jgi:predicted Zn-dependent protease with MMP-like domain